MMHFKCQKTITEHRLLYLAKLSLITEGEREDSKMATRGRKQKACFLKVKSWRELEIHLAGQTTKKMQNSDTSTTPART
jgi:hypothetical protein